MSKLELAYFEPNVEKEREKYLDSLLSLPQSLRIIAERHFHERINRASQPLLGEYTPWLIADILGISDEKDVQQIIVGWLHVYFFTMLLDDMVDRPSSYGSPQDIITAMLLLQRGLCKILDNNANDADVLEVVNSAFADTANAALHELDSHRKRISSFTPEEIGNIGQKIALLRICSKSLVNVAGRDHDCEKWLDVVIYNLAAGIQLLDDLTDWEEDLKAGNMTLLHTLSVERNPDGLNTMQDSNLDSTHNSLAFLVKTGAIEDTLLAALDFFNKSSNQLKQDPTARISHTKTYIESIRSACLNAIPELKNARTRLNQLDYDSSPRNMEDTGEFVQVLNRVRKTLTTVAQGS